MGRTHAGRFMEVLHDRMKNIGAFSIDFTSSHIQENTSKHSHLPNSSRTFATNSHSTPQPRSMSALGKEIDHASFNLSLQLPQKISSRPSSSASIVPRKSQQLHTQLEEFNTDSPIRAQSSMSSNSLTTNVRPQSKFSLKRQTAHPQSHDILELPYTSKKLEAFPPNLTRNKQAYVAHDDKEPLVQDSISESNNDIQQSTLPNDHENFAKVTDHSSRETQECKEVEIGSVAVETDGLSQDPSPISVLERIMKR